MKSNSSSPFFAFSEYWRIVRAEGLECGVERWDRAAGDVGSVGATPSQREV